MTQIPSFYQRGNVDLRGPRGEKGDKGDQGKEGPIGPKGEKGDAGTFSPEDQSRLAAAEGNYISANARIVELTETVADVQGATARRLSLIEADYTTTSAVTGIAVQVATALVEEEATARATAIGAEATARNTLAATLRSETNSKVAAEATERTAAIKEETTARVSDREALSGRLTTIEASYVTSGAVDAKVNAKVSEEATARATAVDAVADRITALEASSGGAVDDVARAAVKTEENARVSAVAAQAARSDTLEAQMARTSPSVLGSAVTTVDARVTEERQARIDSVGAVASRIATVEADYTTAGAVDAKVNAKVSEEATARSQADAAEATARTQLAAALRGETDSKVSAAVSAEAQARTDATGALAGRIGTIEASYVNGATVDSKVNAKVAEEANARANAVQSVADRSSTVEAQLRRELPSALNSYVDGAMAGISQARTDLAATIESRAQAWAQHEAGAVAQTVSQLRSEYNGTASTVTQQAGTIADVNYRTRAYLFSSVVAGDNRAQVTMYADSNMGAGVDIVGNVRIAGDLTVDGSITAQKFNGASMAREGRSSWTGNIAPNVGQTIYVPWSLTLPTLPPTGRFIYEYTITAASNQYNEWYTYDGQGRQIRNIPVPDGGGVFVLATDLQGNVYRPRPNGSDQVVASTSFSPTWVAYAKRGSREELVNNGDGTFTQYFAATYFITAIDLKVTWVAI